MFNFIKNTISSFASSVANFFDVIFSREFVSALFTVVTVQSLIGTVIGLTGFPGFVFVLYVVFAHNEAFDAFRMSIYSFYMSILNFALAPLAA